MDLKDFGSEERPIRASGLPSLLRCPLGAVMEMIAEGDSNNWADTGSAVHRAARAFHTDAMGDIAASLKAMQTFLPEYPLADLGAAEEQFRYYARDGRNQGDAGRVVLCEEKIKIILPPPKGDSSPVVITGTLDQVREVRGTLVLYDIKTGGSAEGDQMLASYCPQLCAYQVGASKLLHRRVNICGIIRTKDYLKTDRQKRPKPGPVFWMASWSLEDAEAVLEEVRRVVGDIRAGRVRVSPSAENCKYCPMGSIGNCITRRKSLRVCA